MASTLSGGNPVSQWISFQSNVYTESSSGLTEYYYTQTFTLGAFNPSTTTLELKGFFAVDNIVLNILIDGNVVTGFTNSGSFSAKTLFDITNSSCGVANCGLINGANTITFLTANFAGASPNPTGLLVEFSSATTTSSVPEPATLFGVGLGLSIVGLVHLRSRVGHPAR